MLFLCIDIVVTVTQVKVLLRYSLKLVEMMMTSQGRMCVQCVANGLDRDSL